MGNRNINSGSELCALGGYPLVIAIFFSRPKFPKRFSREIAGYPEAEEN